MRRLLLAIALVFAVSPAGAERLVTQVSQDEVSITSSFAGETLTLFGSIEPEVGATQRFVEGPYHVIITVTGPLQNRVARRKTNQFGIWLNTAQADFIGVPSFYQVLSDARLADITNVITLAENKIPLDLQPIATPTAATQEMLAFAPQLVRLMEEKGFYRLNETGVVFRSDTFYYARVSLPADAPPGPYLAHTFLFKNGEIIAEKSEGFSVRKIGFERFLGLAARQQPLLYGIVCVALALFTGWLGGVVFRR
ncbi:TIGR02186 family protein [Devosia sp. ZB163]|uniref:TIGR02186 family protein n=1 Tax=Devosia sp. ZB163 TaxID=3025938 RepID=UPI002360B5A0|nr:TIGR02186 family protein [Devosia sp. ZB163]MDC9823479.1 TIGR02186 family protein [Devosia sp. ZB163]